MSYPSDASYTKQPYEQEYSPAAVALTYVAGDATSGRTIDGSAYPRKQQFNMAATGNVIINAPTSGRDGQVLQFLITATDAARTVSFGAGVVSPALVTAGVIASGKTRCLELTYNGTEWFCTQDREESADTSGVAPKSIVTIPLIHASFANGDIVTGYIPGFKGKIVKASYLCTQVTTDADGAATLNLEIGTTNLTGGVITVSNAAMKTLGLVTNGTAITAANEFTATDAISVEAASVTATSDGQGALLLVIEHID